MRALDGYPTSWGSCRTSVFPHAGPASYQRLDITSPTEPIPTAGGDVVEAVSAGLKLFDIVFGSLTDSGLYRVESIPVASSSQFTGAAQPTYRLRWVVVSTGTEVANAVDLSDEVVRLLGIGPK